MELSGVVVLALVSYVTCTPYGYGVKSGAVARAEANAASGAYETLPAVPLSIPSGNGFSGSFSKSSSSSFASSSSSSSSSSSAYSFGGSAANGVAGNSIPSTLHGSPSIHNGFGGGGSTASAAAVVGSLVGISPLSQNANGLPCAGNNCNNAGITNSKCSSNKCGLSGHEHNSNDNKNCLSGQCQPNSEVPNYYGADLQTPNSPTIQQTDLNDFEVNVGGKSKSNTNLSGQTSGVDKIGYHNSQNDCSNGKCAINTKEASAIPTTSTHHNQEPSLKNCNSPDSGCDIFIPLAPSGSAVSTHPQTPSIHLTTPNVGPACSTHNCNPALTGADLNNGKPSSYHVPILGANPSVDPPNYHSNKNPTGTLYNLPSTTPPKPDIMHKIPSYSDGIYSPQSPSSSAGSPSCNGQNCDSITNPAQQASSCNSPNCGVHPNYSGPTPQASFVKPGTVSAPTQSVIGISGSNAKPESHSGPYPHPGHNGFSKPNYYNPTAHTGSDVAAHPESLETPKTNTIILTPSQNTPGYTGGFGAPNKPIDGNFGHINPNSGFGTSGAHGIKPGHSLIPSSLSKPSYTGGFGGSAGSFDTNTGAGSHYQSKPASNPNTVPHNIGISAGSGHDSSGLTKPDSGLPSTQSKPSYAGGFGGSAGSLDTHTGSGSHVQPIPVSNPNTMPHNTGISTGSDHDSSGLPIPDSGLPSSQNIPSYTSSGFERPASPAEVNSGVDTHNKPYVGGAPVTGLHGSFGIKPESGAGISIQKTPTYTGGFGGSPGSFDTSSKIGTHVESKPNHDIIPSSLNTATSSSDHTGSAVTANSGSGSYNSHDIQKPSHTHIPANNGYTGEANNALKPGLFKPVDEKTKSPPYLGGFGGPSGILKPNEYSVASNLPTLPSGTPACTSGVCGSKTPYNLSNGKENILSNGASNDASASATAKAVAYSGSFGGPPGLFKPFDNKHPTNEQDGHTGKIISGEHEKSASGVNSGHDNTFLVKDNEPSDVNKALVDSGNTANAVANANAAAGASSSALSANQGLSLSGCNSGCGSNYDSGTGGSYASSLGSTKTGLLAGHGSPVGSLSSANSVAGAASGAFGAGRSFASSSASAHASAGAAVKGGYGRR